MKVVVNAIVGLMLFGFGTFFLFQEMRAGAAAAHTTHIVIFGFIAFVGALVIRPDPIFAVLKQIIVIAGPYIPMVGGRRAGDPPAPTDGGAS